MGADLDLALRLADAADSISLPHFRTGLAVETKADLTPVTEADREVEAELRRILAGERPDDAVLGEEQGAAGGGSRRWILDPIDGTRNYARGIPVWATLIALETRGMVQVGVVSAPALHSRWWAERGQGAFANGVPAAVNVGVRPTFETGRGVLIESYLIDHNADLYGQTLRIAFIARLRGEKRFGDVDELVAQMGRDTEAARRLCAEFKPPR